MQKNKKNSGFTLIELSIVMMITGIFLVAAIGMYKVYDEKRKFEITELRITDVEQAINNFVETNGRLPCAAPRGVARTSSQYGREESCQSAPIGTVATTGQNGTRVRIGMLPARTLGISDFYMEDAYGHAFLYAVAEEMTLQANYAHDGGGIDVVDSTGTSRLAAADYAQYVLISPGKTDYGAYSNMGVPIVPCDPARLEGENCDDDGIFVDTDLAQGNVEGFFDDRALYKYRLPVTLESEAPPACEQTTGRIFYGGCPEGWSSVSFPSSSGKMISSEYWGDPIPEYYNVLDDGTYFFSGSKLPTSRIPSGNTPTYCSLDKGGDLKQKCFTEEVSFNQDFSVYSRIGDDEKNAKAKCPDGYTLMRTHQKSISIAPGRDGKNRDIPSNMFNVSCSK